MKNKKRYLLCLLLVAWLASPASAIVNLWLGGVSSEWHDPANWIEVGGSAQVVPDSDDHVIINGDWGPPWPVISTDVGHVLVLTPSWWGNSSNPVELEIAAGGLIVVDAWTRLGYCEAGPDTTIVNVTGGALVTASLEVAYGATSTTQVNIDSGYIHAGGIVWGAGTGNIDLEPGATLYITGDVTGDVAGWIAAGLITGGGGELALGYDYDVTNPGLTAVYTVEDYGIPGIDVLADGDCESEFFGAPGWGYAGVVAFSDANGVDGSACVEITPDADPGTPDAAWNQMYQAEPNDLVTAVVAYQTDAGFVDGGDNWLQIRVFDASYNVVASDMVSLPGTGGTWQTAQTATVFCPADTVYVDVIVLGSLTGASTGTLRVDNAELYRELYAYPVSELMYWSPSSTATDPTNWIVSSTTGTNNWGGGIPTPGDFVIVGNPTVDLTGLWPVLDKEVWDVQVLGIGWNAMQPASGLDPCAPQVMYVTDGGKLRISDLNLNPNYGPTYMRIGAEPDSFGILQMDGGEVSTATLHLGWNGIGTAGRGEVYLDGGVLEVRIAGTLSFGQQEGGTGSGLIDITEGTLILGSDSTGFVATAVANGWITAYGGTRSVAYDFNVTTPGKTTVRAAECATFPTADLNKDCVTDIEDLKLLSSEWLIDGTVPFFTVWETTMDTDPVLEDNFAHRGGTGGDYYTMSGGKMVISEGPLGSLNVAVDTWPPNYFNDTTEMWIDFRTTTITTPGDIDYAPICMWFVTSSDLANYAVNRFTIERVSETEQELFVVLNNTTEAIRLTGFSENMVSLHAVVDPNSAGGTITFDATDGTTTYTDQVIYYNNGIPGGPVPGGGSFVTIASHGYGGEVDYWKVTTLSPLSTLFDLTGDEKVDLKDYVVLAVDWLTDNRYE